MIRKILGTLKVHCIAHRKDNKYCVMTICYIVRFYLTTPHPKKNLIFCRNKTLKKLNMAYLYGNCTCHATSRKILLEVASYMVCLGYKKLLVTHWIVLCKDMSNFDQ